MSKFAQSSIDFLIRRTSFDNKCRVETIVNSVEHIRLIIRSIMFDEIGHCIRNFFVFGQGDHWFAADDLEKSSDR